MDSVPRNHYLSSNHDYASREPAPDGPGELLYADENVRIFFEPNGEGLSYYYRTEWMAGVRYEPAFWTLALYDDDLDIAEEIAELLYEKIHE